MSEKQLEKLFCNISKKLYIILFAKKDSIFKDLKEFVDNKYKYDIRKNNYHSIFYLNFNLFYMNPPCDYDPGFYVEFKLELDDVPKDIIIKIMNNIDLNISQNYNDNINIKTNKLLYNINENRLN